MSYYDRKDEWWEELVALFYLVAFVLFILSLIFQFPIVSILVVLVGYFVFKKERRGERLQNVEGKEFIKKNGKDIKTNYRKVIPIAIAIILHVFSVVMSFVFDHGFWFFMNFLTLAIIGGTVTTVFRDEK